MKGRKQLDKMYSLNICTRRWSQLCISHGLSIRCPNLYIRNDVYRPCQYFYSKKKDAQSFSQQKLPFYTERYDSSAAIEFHIIIINKCREDATHTK